MHEDLKVNINDLLRRWRALTHKAEMDQELDEEMRFHLERDIEQNIRNGMTREDARKNCGDSKTCGDGGLTSRLSREQCDCPRRPPFDASLRRSVRVIS